MTSKHYVIVLLAAALAATAAAGMRRRLRGVGVSTMGGVPLGISGGAPMAMGVAALFQPSPPNSPARAPRGSGRTSTATASKKATSNPPAVPEEEHFEQQPQTVEMPNGQPKGVAPLEREPSNPSSSKTPTTKGSPKEGLFAKLLCCDPKPSPTSKEERLLDRHPGFLAEWPLGDAVISVSGSGKILKDIRTGDEVTCYHIGLDQLTNPPPGNRSPPFLRHHRVSHQFYEFRKLAASLLEAARDNKDLEKRLPALPDDEMFTKVRTANMERGQKKLETYLKDLLAVAQTPQGEPIRTLVEGFLTNPLTPGPVGGKAPREGRNLCQI